MNSRASTELLIPKKLQERETTSPERTMIWTEHKFRNHRKVSVIYFISRNGHLDQPHFMEVPLSCSQGLYLRDVINRLNCLRGNGMAKMYSWSSKRSYRNGFVWHDLSENDLIHPTQGREYVLKGSELLRSSLSFRYSGTSGSSENLPGTKFSLEGCDFPATNRRRNQSWSSFEESYDYRVYKAESNKELVGKSADASTQTGDERRRRISCGKENEQCEETTMELSREEDYPPSSNSGSEVFESVRGSRIANQSADIRDQMVDNEHPSGRMKASRVLKQLVSCGSVSVKNC